MAGWYELGMSRDGQFKFVLKADNGDTILTSELYKSKASAENGISSVRANCATDARYDRKEASNGQLYFNLKAANHQVIGTSETYSSERARDGGIESVKKNAPDAALDDATAG